MKLLWRASACVLLFGAALVLTGCPSGPSAADEEKEPHYLAGKSRVNAMDYQGAIESFQKALEVNPRSAAAHFELAWLLERRDPDPAAAIYHYQQYLKLRPSAGNAQVVQQRILACKQELARSVSLGPQTERQQKDIEKMAEENKRLTEENKRLADEANKWRAYFNAQTNQTASANATKSPPSPGSVTGTASARPDTNPAGGSTPAVASKTYVVKSGDTLASIARQYRVKLEALTAANPGVDARRLRLGQTITIP
jgi:LysM repeat protein